MVQYLNLAEVEAGYGWKYQTLHYFTGLGLMEPHYFLGDRLSYWKRTDLESIKNRPREAIKRGPKSHALNKPVLKVTGRARRALALSA
jgi:hypothetical protein